MSEIRKGIVRLDANVMTSVGKLAHKFTTEELQRHNWTEAQAEKHGFKTGVIAKVEVAPVPAVHLRNAGHLKLHNHYFVRQSRQNAAVVYLDASGKQVRLGGRGQVACHPCPAATVRTARPCTAQCWGRAVAVCVCVCGIPYTCRMQSA